MVHAAAGASNIMQRDGEGLLEQQSMKRKHDYVRIINLFIEHETTPPSHTHTHTSLAAQTLTREERVWSNSHQALVLHSCETTHTHVARLRESDYTHTLPDLIYSGSPVARKGVFWRGGT